MRIVEPRTSMATLACSALATALLLPALGSGKTAPAQEEGAAIAHAGTPIYLNPRFSPEERAADLVSRMTLEEKASQLNSSQAPEVERLRVAAFGWWNEAAHGVAREQTKSGENPPVLVNTTSYPVALSQAATWNPDLVYGQAVLISDETREVFRENRLDLSVYSPTVNLARDPRWGRNDESFGEDPFLAAALASQFVNGMEGKDRRGQPLPQGKGFLKVATTLKHYAANNSEFNRRNGSSDMDERTLREYYTAQFRAIVQASSPASIMTAYNAVNGTPVSASVDLLDTLARQTFGFAGFFTSDCDSIFEIQSGHRWKAPGAAQPVDRFGRHAYALTAGVDLDCHQGYHDAFSYGNTLPEAVGRRIATQTGVLTEHDVDAAAVRLFTVRIRLGEFDDPSRVPWVVQARQRVPAGKWVSSDENRAVTETPERLAMARRAAREAIVLLKNDPTKRKDGRARKLLPVQVPASGPFRVAVVGSFANPRMTYLGGYSSNQEAAGVAKTVGTYAGIHAAVRAINPGASVDWISGFTRGAFGVPKLDPASLTRVAGYDLVVVHAGTDADTAAEDGDRRELALPGDQAALIGQVVANNPNTVVYLETVGQVDVSAFDQKVPALLWSSYNGQRKGEALADVLLGVVSPSGRLPFTWYKDPAQLPKMGDYSIRPTRETKGRTYMYFTGDALHPFGDGLGYAEVRISDLEVDRREVDANGRIELSVLVTNTSPAKGGRPAAEVVQLYVATPKADAALERPIKRLRGFEKVLLAPQESRRVRFTVDVPSLAFFDGKQRRQVVDAGSYELQIGRSAADVAQKVRVSVTGSLQPKLALVTAKPIASGDEAAGVSRRVFFPPNVAIDPRLTVALSDDALFGYVTKGASRPLPEGIEVRYDSNRPEVVSADPSGVLRTGDQAGVATVTAHVGYQGARASTTFVVSVRPGAEGSGPRSENVVR
jgi:beta-glucosidase